MLSSNETGLKIFENSITIDRTLPKYKRLEEIENKKSKMSTNPFMDVELVPIARGEDFETFRNLSPHGMNVYLKENDYEHFLTGGRLISLRSEVNGFATPVSRAVPEATEPQKKNFFERLFGKKNKAAISETTPEGYELDVVAFFSEIKKTAKIDQSAYRDRVEGYIKAMKMADISGQEALKEKLLVDMVINKYESILYASGHLHVVTEEQAVEFAKKAEKGISLTYIKNFLHPIPLDVVEKMREANELEIFDNYVVMHYDPDKVAVKKTHAEETEEAKEEIKKRDPILFGVISGSNKLYYIADWVDEYCDLTLEQFAEVLQNEGGINALTLQNEIPV